MKKGFLNPPPSRGRPPPQSSQIRTSSTNPAAVCSLHRQSPHQDYGLLSKLPDDIWKLILSKQKAIDRVRSEIVCLRWLKLVENLAPTLLPWLVLPPKGNGFSFFNHEDKFYHMKNLPKEKLYGGNGVFLGSCYGWLLYWNDDLELMLLNPFSRNQIPLPQFVFLLDLLAVQCETASGPVWFSPKTLLDLRGCIRSKVVLSSQPTCNEEKKIGVVVMYTLGMNSLDKLRYNNLAFCTTKDLKNDSKWTKLNEPKWYLDIVSHEQQFYTLCEDYSVEVWDFPNASSPIKMTVIQGEAPRMADDPRFSQSLIRESWIVKKGEDILLLVLRKDSRYDKTSGVILVYKLDSDGRWTTVYSIGPHALILGSNQAILVPRRGNVWDSDHKGLVYFINKVSYYDNGGDDFYASVFRLGGEQFEILENVENVKYPVNGVSEPDPLFYWVEAPF